MVEHELFLNTIPLALLASEPVALALMALWKLPPEWRRAFGRGAIRYSLLARIGAWFSLRTPALFFIRPAPWVWHVPAVYDYALRYGWAHALERGSFLSTALLYWRPLLILLSHKNPT